MKRIISLLLGIAVSLACVGVPKHTNAVDNYLTYDELRAYQEKQAENEWSNQLVAYASTLVGQRTGQCVLALRQRFGVPAREVSGAAKSTKINSPVGKVGSVIIFKNLSKWGHVGILLRDEGDSWLYFHSNYGFNGRGRVDRIKKTDKHISGYRIINYQ